MSISTLEQLKLALREFARERDWQQFHSPKNLAMALVGEAGEVVEHFQWLTEQQSRALPQDARDEVELELADVLIYLVELADQLDVDLLAAARRKMAINARKYPAEQVRGKAEKYDRY
jgi:NTP pyrophosphatase (non-canonical NTP hydrolase)